MTSSTGNDQKGRDFFDAVFLLSRGAKPDYGYLDLKLSIKDAKSLKDRLLNTCSKLDMKAMADDVAPFLFTHADTKKIILFEQYFEARGTVNRKKRNVAPPLRRSDRYRLVRNILKPMSGCYIKSMVRRLI